MAGQHYVLGAEEGWLVLNSGRNRGFTLIELMISISLIAILLMMGVPAFSTYLQNAKLRAAAENFYSGVQLARAEAVRRNAQVQIVLTDSAVATDTDANAATLSATGANWMVRGYDPSILSYYFIEGKASSEGSGTVGAAPTQVTGSDASNNPLSSITYNGFGSTTGGGRFNFTNPSGGTCAPGGTMRCLTVVVSNAGQARMCDPAVTAVGDTRKC
jgi:type IV fimbrial biogenesis protein FimT